MSTGARARTRTWARTLGLGGALLLLGCPRFHEGPLPDEPQDDPYAELPDGTRIHFVEQGQGQGDPVVMIHGFASSLDTWAAVRPELEDRHVLALDLKGFGWSERPPGDYSPLAEARVVFALMDQRGIDRAAVVAHSWGASVALAMALEQPQRVSRLALYDAWVFEEQLPTTFLWARASGLGEVIFSTFYRQRADDKMATAFYEPEKLEQSYVDRVHEMLRRPGTIAAALAAVRGQRYAAYQERYRKIEQPTLLLWGREDTVTTVEDGERLASMLPHAEMIVYPRCGHFPMHEARAASTRDLVEFLQPEAEHDDAQAPAHDETKAHARPAPSQGPATAPRPVPEPARTPDADDASPKEAAQ